MKPPIGMMERILRNVLITLQGKRKEADSGHGKCCTREQSAGYYENLYAFAAEIVAETESELEVAVETKTETETELQVVGTSRIMLSGTIWE